MRPGGSPDLELPYTRTLLVGLAVRPEPRRVLIVGLGGGSLASFLRHHYPDTTIDAVEINPRVVTAAREAFGFREDGRLRVHVMDGAGYLRSGPPPYDLIFLDAFGPDGIPAHLTTREFLQSVWWTLLPGGAAVGNLWGPRLSPGYAAMVRAYQEVFGELCLFPIPGRDNVVVLALPRAIPLSREELVARARRVSDAKRFPFDLGSQI